MPKDIVYSIKNVSEADLIAAYNQAYPLENPWTLVKIAAKHKEESRQILKNYKIRQRTETIAAEEEASSAI